MSKDIEALIQEIDSYGEISPSGKGIRIIAKGAIAEGIKNRRNDIAGAKGVEVYDNGRYLTITGEALYGEAKPVKDLSDGFWSFYQQLGGSKATNTFSGIKGAVVLTDNDQWVINKLLEDDQHGPEFRRLYVYGDTSSYEGDQSRADLKLVHFISYYAGFNEEQIDRIFRSGKLFRAK